MLGRSGRWETNLIINPVLNKRGGRVGCFFLRSKSVLRRLFLDFYSKSCAREWSLLVAKYVVKT